jgi:riboflavin biosynthesis pyrimidine reductase
MAAESLTLPTLELLFEADGLPAFDLPDALAAAYAGPLGFEEPRLFANFVATIDGVVAIPSLPLSNKLIAAGSAADRFVMGLVRACAEVLVIGSGTLKASPRGVWTPEQAFPPAADGFAELRRRLGRPPVPEVAVVSASGRLDPSHPAFEAGAIVLTSAEGAGRLAGKLPGERVVTLAGEHRIDASRIVEALRGRGHRLILSEGGPHAIGPLLAAGLVDELFLTVSPLLAGRDGGDPRLALVEGTDLVAAGPVGARVLGVRRSGDHLFLRYEIGASRDTAGK